MLEQTDLSRVLVLDIETVPQHPHFEEVPPHLAALWEQKTQYHRKELLTPAEYYHRAGIWAEFGKIVCISIGAFTLSKSRQGFKVKSFYGKDERQLLIDCSALLNKQRASTCLCAHNGKEFDFPYLCRRMLIMGLPIPPMLHLSGKKPWEVNHLDTMELWKFGDYKNYTSLALLAAIFDLPGPKDDMSGEDVNAVYWKENDLERIRTYCEIDVITTAQLLLRFKGLPLIPDDAITLVK